MRKSTVLESANELELDKMIVVREFNIFVAAKYFKKCKDYTKMIERMIQIMDIYKQVQDTQNKDLFANIIFDLEDIFISNIDFDFLKHLIVFFEERYENIINIIYCKNVNLIFRMCYKILRPFISKDLKEKLKFIRKGSTEILDSMPDNESDEE